ncbi:hypothetical protein PAXINDRAFT_101257 [Paxillus involutus ATCC 200175]|uniref:Uncharacterized protein n=1 Tax=Paxillus involutus ATCC 200175 TaxID=664439 RepID=A0A0C9T9L2_PAXIN|nr:hypothetical protein PAXINDRAFT_101257 [Paxillus involutus ATCC 200175]
MPEHLSLQAPVVATIILQEQTGATARGQRVFPSVDMKLNSPAHSQRNFGRRQSHLEIAGGLETPAGTDPVCDMLSRVTARLRVEIELFSDHAALLFLAVKWLHDVGLGHTILDLVFNPLGPESIFVHDPSALMSR